jgi:hypothetical protein
MISLAFFIEKIAYGLYILSAGGIFVMAYRLQQARRELALAQFKLEREQALVKQASAITFGGFLIEFLVGVWAVANLVAPTLRDIRVGDNPASAAKERFTTSTPAANPAVALNTGGQENPGDVIFATQTPAPTPVGTIVPDAPDVVGCPRDSAWLHIPGNGQRIFEATTIVGVATIPDFAFYRFEIKPAVAGAEFAPLPGDYTDPVNTEGPLGEILPFAFPPGEYRFRLTVFDKTNVMRSLCEVTIHMSEPPPTPTPLGAAAQTPAPSQ